MFYNLYIEHTSGKKYYKVALDQEEINFLKSAYLSGKEFVRIKGENILIKNPLKIFIYSINENIGSNKTDVEAYFKREARFEPKGKLTVRLFGMKGSNVTSSILGNREWGSGELTASNNLGKSEGKIFISHSAKDATLVKLFVDMILLLGLELKRKEDIFCISVDGSGIRSGDDFKIKIKNELTEARAVIQILTVNYKASEICLNEMGASWVLNENVIPFVVPPLNYDIGFIHANTQQLKISAKDDLIKFYDDYKGILFSKEISIINYTHQVDNFLKAVNEIK